MISGGGKLVVYQERPKREGKGAKTARKTSRGCCDVSCLGERDANEGTELQQTSVINVGGSRTIGRRVTWFRREGFGGLAA